MDRPVQHDDRDADRDGQRDEHSDRDAGDFPRHQHQSPRSRELQLPAVALDGIHGRFSGARRDGRSSGRHVRPDPRLQHRIRHLHGVRDRSLARLEPGLSWRDRADRPAHGSGGGGRHGDGQRSGDPNRCISLRPARPGARHQPDRGYGGLVHRHRRRRRAGRDQLAVDLHHQRADRVARHDLGLLAAS